MTIQIKPYATATITLTERQRIVMACAKARTSIEQDREIPNGVYRSLVCKGLLYHRPGRYEVTEQGRIAAANQR